MIPLLVPIGLGLIGGYLTKESDHEMFAKGGGVDSEIRGGVRYVKGKDLEWYDIRSFDIDEYGEQGAKEKAEKYISEYIKYWKGELNQDDFKIRKTAYEYVVMRLMPKYAKGGGIGGRKGKYSLDYLKMKQEELDELGDTLVGYDEKKSEWYWEDYKNDIYRSKFKSEIDAYDNLVDYLENDYKQYAKGGGVEKEYLVTLQHSENGELIELNVLGTSEQNAVDNAYLDADLNQPYELYSVKEMDKRFAKGGKTKGGVVDNLIMKKDVEVYRNEAPHNTFDIYEFDEAKEGSVIDKIAKGDTMSGTILGKSKGHYIFEDEHTSTLYYVPTNSVKQGKKERIS